MGKFRNNIALYAITGMMSVSVTGAFAGSHAATVGNTMGINVAFSNQIELSDFEAQSGATLTFTGNPLFADREASGDLTALTCH